MATDYWTDGTANWDTPSDWSAGLPDSSSGVVIDEGNPEVTASFGTVASIANSSLTFIDAGASSVTGDVTNYGDLSVDQSSGDGGSSLSISGTLTNTAGIEIGNGALSANSTIEAASLANVILSTYGVINLYGSSTAQASLDVASPAGFGAAGTLYGNVNLYGDARIEFASGKIRTSAANSELSLTDRGSVVADANAGNQNWNSALSGLGIIAGRLNLQDSAVVTTGALTTSNGGAILLDGFPGEGGSTLNVLGTLTNDGSIGIGNSGGLPARSMLTAASIVNNGFIAVAGDGSTSIHATLDTIGSFVNDGSVSLIDDYDKLVGAVSGTGTFKLSDDSTMEFAGPVARGQKVDFFINRSNVQINRLSLDEPSSFAARIDDFFTKGDVVIAKGFAEAATLLTYAQTGADSCSWTLANGSHSAVLDFAGEPYAKSDFSIVPAQGGAGLAIKFV